MNFSSIVMIFSIEIRKLLSYRVEFWLQFIAAVLVNLGVYYFLWKSIFDFNQVDQLQGMSFSQLMIYYFLIPFIDRIVRSSENFSISQDIYSGTLNRYLIFPLSFFGYKYLERLAYSFLGVLQMLMGLLIIGFFTGWLQQTELSLQSFLLGLVFSFYAGIFQFFLIAALEMISFWADNIWSLIVMARLATFFAGGGLVPLEFFPLWVQEILYWTPFPYLIAVPIQLFLGRADQAVLLQGLWVMAAWIAVSSALAVVMWRRGLRVYAGVGQ